METVAYIQILGGMMFAYAQFVIGGITYRWSGWLGCQLESTERKRVHAGTTRKLKIDCKLFEMKVFTTKRIGFMKFRTTWSIFNGGTLEEHGARIRELRDALKGLV